MVDPITSHSQFWCIFGYTSFWDMHDLHVYPIGFQRLFITGFIQSGKPSVLNMEYIWTYGIITENSNIIRGYENYRMIIMNHYESCPILVSEIGYSQLFGMIYNCTQMVLGCLLLGFQHHGDIAKIEDIDGVWYESKNTNSWIWFKQQHLDLSDIYFYDMMYIYSIYIYIYIMLYMLYMLYIHIWYIRV